MYQNLVHSIMLYLNINSDILVARSKQALIYSIKIQSNIICNLYVAARARH